MAQARPSKHNIVFKGKGFVMKHTQIQDDLILGFMGIFVSRCTSVPLCVHNPNQKAFVTVVSPLQFYVAVKAISSLNTFFLLLPSEQIIMFLLDIKLQNTGQDIAKDTVALFCKRTVYVKGYRL